MTIHHPITYYAIKMFQLNFTIPSHIDKFKKIKEL